jgi:ribonuclease J
MSGLARMAAGTHSDLTVEEGDTLIYSARAIPGNERTITTVINNFYRAGADVFTEGQARVHVSGHGSRDDLRHMLNMVKPRYFLPTHGEVRHQVMHRKLAGEEGIPPENVFLMENGDRWTFDGKQAKMHGKVAAGEVLVDGKGLGDTGDVVLRDRKHLSEHGIVMCMLSVSKENREILAGPEIIARGLAFEGESEAILEEAKERVRNAIAGYGGSYNPNWEEVRALVTQVLKKFFKQRTESRPIILPIVMEL